MSTRNTVLQHSEYIINEAQNVYRVGYTVIGLALQNKIIIAVKRVGDGRLISWCYSISDEKHGERIDKTTRELR